MNALDGVIAATRRKIAKLAEYELYFYFGVETVLSLVALEGTALQAICMAMHLGNSITSLFAIHMSILGILLLCFLKVILHQIIKRFKGSPGKMVVASILVLPFWPLLVFCSEPAITLRRLKKGNSNEKWCFMVPQTFPCDLPINYLMFVLKTLAYWMALVVRKTPFTDTF